MNTDNMKTPVNSETPQEVNPAQLGTSERLNRLSFISTAFESMKFDKNKIGNILQEGVQNAGQLADSIPLIGHAKGGLHYLYGDSESGLRAMKASSRTTGVIFGGFLGFSAGGPIGGALGGIAGGQMMDGATTALESAVHKEFRPNGSWTEFTKIAEGKLDQVDYKNLAFGAGLDAFLGYSFGNPSTLESLTNVARYTYNTGSSLIAGQTLLKKKYLYTTNLLKQSIPVMALLSQMSKERHIENDSLEKLSEKPREYKSVDGCKKLVGLTGALLDYHLQDDAKHKVCTTLSRLHEKGL